jgi:hypothetical protein
MLGRWLRISLCCGLFAFTAAAQAQTPATSARPELHEQLTKAYGLNPAEEAGRPARPAFRAFLINAYGEGMGAIVYSRAGDGRGRLDVHVLGGQTAKGVASFSVILGPEEIGQAEALIKAVRDSPEKGRREPDGVVELEGGLQGLRMCHHPWTALVEVIDRNGVTRRERISCHDDTIYERAYGLGAMALAKLPQCRVLARENSDPQETLDLCATLAGDLSAAAAVRLKVDNSRVRRWEGEADEDLPGLLADDAQFELPDRKAAGRDAVLAELRRFEGVQFTGVVRGLSAGEVVLDGSIMRYVDRESGEPDAFYAPVSQRWVKRGDDWLLAAMKVGPFSKGRPDPRDTWTGAER